jgi:hypothetical protein
VVLVDAAQRQPCRVEPDPGLVTEFGADYADAFTASASARHSAREWAYASLRGAEAAGGAFGRGVWGGLLGFRLATKGTAGTLVGWQVSVDDPNRLVLDADGRLMAGRMTFLVSGTEVTWTTMLRYHRPAARRIWAAAGHAHRALAPRCLRAARHSLGRAAPAQR